MTDELASSLRIYGITSINAFYPSSASTSLTDIGLGLSTLTTAETTMRNQYEASEVIAPLPRTS